MSTALQKLSTDIELSDAQKLIMAEQAEENSGFDMQNPRLKLGTGGINDLVTEDGEMYKEIRCIIALSQKARAYWPESGTGKPPLCSSPDGSSGYFDDMAEDDRLQAATQSRYPHPAILLIDQEKPLQDFYNCHTCPLNQWGSEHQRRGQNGRGKACRELRRLVLILDEFAVPVLLTLPPTSIRSFDQYASGLQARRAGYFAVWTRLSLRQEKSRSGETYNVTEFAVDGAIDEMEKLQAVVSIRSEFKELVKQMAVTGDEYEIVDAVDDEPVEDAEEEPPF